MAYLAEHRPQCVDARQLRAIRQHVGRLVARARPPRRSYLVDILLSTSVEVDRRIGGIPPDLRGRLRSDSLAQAKESLLDLTNEYAQARDPDRAGDVRRTVLRTKEHVQLALARPMSPEKRAVKQELHTWLLVWLENPAIFPSWLAVRERKARGK